MAVEDCTSSPELICLQTEELINLLAGNSGGTLSLCFPPLLSLRIGDAVGNDGDVHTDMKRGEHSLSFGGL